MKEQEVYRNAVSLVMMQAQFGDILLSEFTYSTATNQATENAPALLLGGLSKLLHFFRMSF